MNYAEWTRRTREETHPSPQAIGRVRLRLDLRLAKASELASLPGPRPGATTRVKERLARSREQRALQWGSLLPLAVGAMAFAMASAGLVVHSRGDAVPTQRLLASAGSEALSEHVRAEHEGEGRVYRLGEDLSIDWEIGRLTLDVDPGQAHVLVRTAEGTVEVVGTHFTVERGPLGTSVSVERGTVMLRCGSPEGGSPAGELALEAGDSTSCWPVTAAGLLNRARALAGLPGSPEQDTLLATVDRGLSLPAAGPVRAELLSLETSALLSLGRQEEALDAAEQALAAGPDPVRALELHRTAARLSLLWGYCDRAAPHLDALPSLTAEEQAHRERCQQR